MKTKTCTKCNVEKPLDREHYYWYNTKQRWHSQCKLCKNAYSKMWDSKIKTLDPKYKVKSVQKNFIKEAPGVYMLKNLITGEFYIGASCKPIKRREEHLSGIKTPSGASKLHQAVKQYGRKSFIFGVVEHCNNYFKKEKEYIKKLKPQYNDN
jgi:predicted GIY-YIG superfamily endonuclease